MEQQGQRGSLTGILNSKLGKLRWSGLGKSFNTAHGQPECPRPLTALSRSPRVLVSTATPSGGELRRNSGPRARAGQAVAADSCFHSAGGRLEACPHHSAVSLGCHQSLPPWELPRKKNLLSHSWGKKQPSRGTPSPHALSCFAETKPKACLKLPTAGPHQASDGAWPPAPGEAQPSRTWELRQSDAAQGFGANAGRLPSDLCTGARAACRLLALWSPAGCCSRFLSRSTATGGGLGQPVKSDSSGRSGGGGRGFQGCSGERINIASHRWSKDSAALAPKPHTLGKR